MPQEPLPRADLVPDSRLGGTVAVFDPPMCCPTGLCGPGVDPALLALARDLRWLQTQGVTVERHGLSQEPGAFVSQPMIAVLLRDHGDRALPAVLVNGEIIVHGRYPTRSELLQALAGSLVPEPKRPAESSGGGSDSGCC